ncbi:hypothetical protein DYB32_010432 [Aphanomyces invadans]|uniref:Reverse transcriptase domain-containing protein n=1 Tax=Aphanomyces invadans TaxID=157072 RepID=A0A3R7A1I8_9STRA|nr:hypothetical protein DYB32_010432 [Aphanomyces invadans]
MSILFCNAGFFSTRDIYAISLADRYKPIVDNDDLRLISHLLTNTSLKLRNQFFSGRLFNTSIGTPQGDSLSPVLFIVNLEAALRDLRRDLLPKLDINFKTIDYADSIDILCSSKKPSTASSKLLPLPWRNEISQ